MALHYDGELRIHKLELTGGPWTANCYIVVCPGTRESVIIDAPAQGDLILGEALGTKVRYLLLTHTHGDHLQALVEVKAATGAPVALHRAETGQLPVAPDLYLEDGDFVAFGGMSLEVRHTPGHTPGSLCFHSGRHLFGGDTIFPGGPGHTRTPEALRQLIKSLEERLFSLPADTAIYPGHGPDALLGREREAYRRFAARPHPTDLCGDVLWTM